MSEPSTTNQTAERTKPLREFKKRCDEVAKTAPGDTHTLASVLQKMSLNFYEDVRSQARQSFYIALGAAAVGTLMVLFGIGAMMSVSKWVTLESSELSVVAGVAIQVISAINFYLYGKTARQFALFHICLERTNRFLLANTLCENVLEEKRRDDLRIELVRLIATAPMLTLDVLTTGAPQQEVSESNLHSETVSGNNGSRGTDKQSVDARTTKVGADNDS